MKLASTVNTLNYILEVNILGLRQLESYGLMPIRKPYVVMRAKSLLPVDKADSVANVKTDPNASGPNANINNTLSFNVDLPTNPLYCPSLTCDVYDYVFMGFSQPLIGTFCLDIGELKGL